MNQAGYYDVCWCKQKVDAMHEVLPEGLPEVLCSCDARLSENRPTIFLSNLAPIDLVPIIGERIVDRIKGKCVAQRFSGESRRKPLTADVFGVAA